MSRYQIINKIIIEDNRVFLAAAYNDQRPLTFLRSEEPFLSETLRTGGVQAMLSVVLRRVYRGEYRLRAQSRITRALRESIHAFPMELIGKLDEDTVVVHLAAVAEQLLLDHSYDPMEDLALLSKTINTEDQKRKVLRVRLLGTIELKNDNGQVKENPARQSRPWMLLKYLLALPEREADLLELLRAGVWSFSEDGEGGEGAARVRLRRLRESLSPLGLDGKQGLVLFQAGKYRLNPDVSLIIDVDELSKLWEQLVSCEEDDPAGLQLCREALELCRGPYMEHTADVPWLENQRDFYDKLFIELVRTTLRRCALQNNFAMVDLLCCRAAVVVPKIEEIQQEIISFLVKHRLEKELIRHMTHLLRDGKLEWFDHQ